MPDLKYYTKEQLKKYYQQYKEKNYKKLLNYHREYIREWRRKNKRYYERWKKENRNKVLVAIKLRKAVKGGIVKKYPCVICGNKKAQAHHPNYSKPLKVIWLCAIHHKWLHLRKIKIK